MVNAPWYVINGDIQRDLGMDTVDSVIKKFNRSHEDRLHQHVNPKALQLLDNLQILRRLKRTKPFKLV